MENAINEIKEMRLEIDGYFNLMGNLDRSREISIAITSAQNGKMWLGQTLKHMGNENPYPESKNPDNEKIEPTADSSKGKAIDVLAMENQPPYSELSHIQKIKLLRLKITAIAENFEKPNLKVGVSSVSELLQLSLVNAYTNILESNMWLGMELGRVFREQENK